MPNSMNAGPCDISCILQETTKLSSTVDKLFDIPRSREQEFLLLHVPNFLEFGCLITSYIIHVIVASFYIFPDINYCVEHLFICRYPKYVSSLVRCPIRSLDSFTIEFDYLLFGF